MKQDSSHWLKQEWNSWRESAHTTGASAETSSSSAPPADVRPGHMILAPANTNFMAPLSTRNIFMIPGSLHISTLFQSQILNPKEGIKSNWTVLKIISNWLLQVPRVSETMEKKAPPTFHDRQFCNESTMLLIKP